LSDIDAFFDAVELPSINQLAQTLIETLLQTEPPVRLVRDLIVRDPALSAKLLRLANSAQFGLPRGVANIDDAIAMVGLNKIRSLALGACLTVTFEFTGELDRATFWRSSMRCAGFAQWLSTPLGLNGHVAWLTGMMLRLGELLIAQARPEILDEIEQLPRIPGVRWQREKRLLGFTESQITAELARRWNFPLQMVNSLQRAADPLASGTFSPLAGALHLAALLAEIPEPQPDNVKALPMELIVALQLEPQWLVNCFPDVHHFIDVS
jgi:HD-like signal output (HDOD) protein